MSLKELHNEFRVNGQAFNSVQKLKDYAYTISDPLGDLIHDWYSNSDFLEMKTSGSTGEPKPIRLQKNHIANSVKTTTEFFEIKPGSRALLCLPLTYVAGKLMVLRALLSGWHLVITDPSSKPLIREEDLYDFVAMVPLQLENSISKLNQIRKLIVGGGKVSENTISKIQNTPCEVYETYGMTETITHIAVRRINHCDHAPSFFKVLPNISILKDERDCLVIKAPKISDDVIVTNDVVQLISDTQFKWLGRYDHIINSGGIKLNPEVIEHKLKSIIHKRFFVIGQPDEKLGEKLVVVVEDESKKNYDYWISEIRKTHDLVKFEKPKKIVALSYFLETPSGKIKRSETIKVISPIFESDI